MVPTKLYVSALTHISIAEDPRAWGYHPLEGRKSFVPDPGAPAPPFQLLLVGAGWLEIPDELAYVVSTHTDLPYKDFYKLIADCDIVVPAFADNTCEFGAGLIVIESVR